MNASEPIESDAEPETTEREPTASNAGEIATPGGIGESVTRAIEDLRSSANVRSVYGDPIEVGAKTIIPVARIAYGFGGGFGAGSGDEGDGDGAGEGGGGGGGAAAKPVGVVEVTDEETRFVRLLDGRRLAAAMGLGVLLGLLLGRRR